MGSSVVGLESKVESLANQLKADVCMELRKDMEEMFEKWGKKVEHMVSSANDNISEKVSTNTLDRGSSGIQQNSTGDSSGLGRQMIGYVPLIQEPDSQNTTMQTIRLNTAKNRIECPRFEGHDFLGWQMKVEQFFEAVGTPNDAKVQTIMIHLDGKAL